MVFVVGIQMDWVIMRCLVMRSNARATHFGENDALVLPHEIEQLKKDCHKIQEQRSQYTKEQINFSHKRHPSFNEAAVEQLSGATKLVENMDLGLVQQGSDWSPVVCF